MYVGAVSFRMRTVFYKNYYLYKMNFGFELSFLTLYLTHIVEPPAPQNNITVSWIQHSIQRTLLN